MVCKITPKMHDRKTLANCMSKWLANDEKDYNSIMYIFLLTYLLTEISSSGLLILKYLFSF